MKNSNPHAASLKSEIECIEVLVSRNSIAKNLQWTLSVYSLENNPVTRHPAIHNCDVYHFMNFDWKRTIKQLLEEHEVPYTIVQHFSFQSIHAVSEHNSHFDESHIVSVLNQREETTPSPIRHHDPDLVLHHETV